MKTKFLAALLVVLGVSVLLSGCGSADSNTMQAPAAKAQESKVTAEYHKITQEQAKERMTKNPKVIILDVRTPQEYKDGHIDKAINVPNEDINTTPPKELPDKNAEILVYCRSGHRSKQASDKLVKMGYKHIYDFGGITTWPYETESGAYQAK